VYDGDKAWIVRCLKKDCRFSH